MKIQIKPLTVNQCWQGRKYKTKTYLSYEREFLILLHTSKWKPIIYPKMTLQLKIGLSNKLADIDNVLKPLQDILQKMYHFNDHQIYRLEVDKIIVQKKQEFIEIELKEL